MVQLSLAPKRVALCLLAGFGGLLVCYVATAVVRVETGSELRLLALFDFDREATLPTWYNSILLLIAATVSWINGNYARKLDPLQAFHWRVIAVIFLALSIDELAALHELLANFRPIASRLYFGWMVFLVPLAIALGLWFVPFLLRVRGRIAFCLVAAGIIYLTGAVALEVVGRMIVEGIAPVAREQITSAQWAEIGRSYAYLAEVALEESFEQCGLILYIYAALSYLSEAGATMSFSLSSREAHAPLDESRS